MLFFPHQRNDVGAVLLRKSGNHFIHRLPTDRVNPRRHNIAQRDQNERTVLHARVRKDQTAGRSRGLRIRRQIFPCLIRRPVRRNQITACDNIKIKNTRLPAHVANTPGSNFEIMQVLQIPAGRQEFDKWNLTLHDRSNR